MKQPSCLTIVVATEAADAPAKGACTGVNQVSTAVTGVGITEEEEEEVMWDMVRSECWDGNRVAQNGLGRSVNMSEVSMSTTR